jgi:hypothetical protein
MSYELNTMGELKKQSVSGLIDEHRLIKILVWITIILIGLNVISELLGNPSWQIERLIKLDYESNFSTWFSSLLLLIAAFFAYKCSLVTDIKQRGQRMWQLFSLGLLGMSCDEVAMIHENLGKMINKHFLKLDTTKHFCWVFTVGPLALLIIVVFAIKIKTYLKGSLT